MQTKTILIAAVATVLCGWLAAWTVWNRDVTLGEQAPELKQQADMQRQLNYLRVEMDGLKKEVEDFKKLVKVYKRQVVAAKGHVLNADQDIQRMLETALNDEPVRSIANDAELVKRARALGLTTVEVR